VLPLSLHFCHKYLANVNSAYEREFVELDKAFVHQKISLLNVLSESCGKNSNHKENEVPPVSVTVINKVT
jgi:hypothetical protein